MSDPSPDDDLRRLATAPTLLVALDFDGTLAPIVDRPEDARPLPRTVAALERLAALPRTHVAVLSGRGRADLAALLGLPDGRGVHLVGSHGAEDGEAGDLTPELRALRDRIARELERVAAGVAGLLVERKPAGSALHWRLAREEDGLAARERALAGPGSWAGVRARDGKKVLELSVVAHDKGGALAALRARLRADAVVFVGDDVTDEDAFARLRPGDLGVKVGEGPSVAGARVADPDAVADLLERLAALRSAT